MNNYIQASSRLVGLFINKKTEDISLVKRKVSGCPANDFTIPIELLVFVSNILTVKILISQ